jgi:hypothetical protein
MNGRERAYNASHGIKTIWQGGAYADKESGYAVRASLGMSEKGYHAGLTFTPPQGEAKTTWHRPVQRRDHAMAESYSAFNGWVKNHEAHLDSKHQPKDVPREIAGVQESNTKPAKDTVIEKGKQSPKRSSSPDR